MPDLFSITAGLGGAFVATVRNPVTGALITTYAGTEPLAGSISAGQGEAALFTFTPTWISGPLGTISVPIPAASTASLDVGRYQGDVHLTDLSADLCAFWLEVSQGISTSAVLTFYASFQEMLNRAPAIEKMQRPTDIAGFAQQRYEARAWFEDLLQRHHRGPSGWPTDNSFGWGSWAGYGNGTGSGGVVGYRDGRRSTWLQTLLDANALVVTRPVVEAVTCYALALIYDRQSMAVADGASFAAASRKFFRRAEDAASSITAEITVANECNRVIRLGISDTLEG